MPIGTDVLGDKKNAVGGLGTPDCRNGGHENGVPIHLIPNNSVHVQRIPLKRLRKARIDSQPAVSGTSKVAKKLNIERSRADERR